MSDTISLRRFARDAASLTQPTLVRQGDDVIGTFLPKGWPTVAGLDSLYPSVAQVSSPASRSEPVIPSGSLVVGTAETDRAQIGRPDHKPMTSSGSASHEPGVGTEVAALGSSPLAIVPPKPDGYVHDPHFNSKGSRPAPKTGGKR